MIKEYSAKSYWIQVLFCSVMQIFLPKIPHFLFPSVSLFPCYMGFLLLSTIGMEAIMLRCYSSSKLREVIIVWILSSALIMLSNMFGFFLFNKESPQLMILFLLAVGLFVMLFYLLLIIRSYKK